MQSYARGFKDDANNMTHSWYHIARKQEIDEKDFQQILDLIADLERKGRKLNTGLAPVRALMYRWRKRLKL